MRPAQALLAAILGLVALFAQPPAPPRPIGVVLAVDAGARRITLKTDTGPEITIELLEIARFLRVAPGSQDLASATRIAISDLSAGDRILARGRPAATPSSFTAELIVVMSKADLARKQEADRSDWDRRGIAGSVVSIDPVARTITIQSGDRKAPKAVTLATPTSAILRRYSPDSIRFIDARPCRLEDLKPGDQVKARGSTPAGGSAFVVEELVSGSFRDLSATILAVDAPRGSVQLQDLASKSNLEARVLAGSLLRRLSPEAVQAISTRISGASESTPASGRALQSLIENSPAFRIADLKPGDFVVLSATFSDDPAKLTAITILAGAEPLLKPASKGARPSDIGSWNLDLNMGLGNP